VIIVISGIPGVGKSTIAKRLAEIINAEVIDILEFSLKNKLYQEFDEILNTYIVDENRLFDELKKHIENIKDKDIIIEGNFAHLFPDGDLYFVIKADPNIVYKRLEERGYTYNKIFENIWAMNLEVIEDELEYLRKEYYIFYNNKEEDLPEIINKMVDIIKKKKNK